MTELLQEGKDYRESLQNHIEGESLKGIDNPSSVFKQLVEKITPLNIREYLGILDEKKQVKQKHIVVAIIRKLLETAKIQNWNLATVNDYLYVYNGQYWLQCNKEDIRSFLGEVAKKMGHEDYEADHYEFKEKLYKQFISSSHLPEPPKETDKVLINLKNGTMEFTEKGWKMRSFNPDDFLTYQLPFKYDKKANCKLYNDYLNRVLPDKECQMILQEFAGFIFTNMNVEKMLVLYGSGQNGKSVWFNIMSAILGKQNILTYSLGMFNHEYNRAKLTNVLVNYSSEKGTDLNIDTFKALISGEPLQAREPYGKSFTLNNKVKFIINTNELPKETEQTEAYFRRFLIIPFNQHIPDSEKDISLSKKIIDNELPGLFNWILEGLDRLLEKKEFTYSEKSKTALESFKKQSDSVALFIDEHDYVDSKNEKTLVKNLYESYRSFCDDDNYRAVSKNNFSQRLVRLGFEKERDNGGQVCFCIEKKTSSDIQKDF